MKWLFLKSIVTSVMLENDHYIETNKIKAIPLTRTPINYSLTSYTAYDANNGKRALIEKFLSYIHSYIAYEKAETSNCPSLFIMYLIKFRIRYLLLGYCGYSVMVASYTHVNTERPYVLTKCLTLK